MRIWRRRKEEPQHRSLISISDPAAVEFFGGGHPNFSGVEVGESSSLSVAAVYRAVALISGTIATLPLRTIQAGTGTSPTMQQRVSSFLDTPGGAKGPTPFEWKETVLLHLLLHGNAYLLKIQGGAGQLVALAPIHPLSVSVEPADKFSNGRMVSGGKIFRTDAITGSMDEYDDDTIVHIPAMSMDGVRGLSVVSVARNSIGTAIAGDRAAAKMFSQGGMISGMVTADGDDVDEQTEAPKIKEVLERKVSGWENASAIRFINRKLKFTSWTMSAEDMQFLQSRSFQVEEIARWFGVPPHLLMQTEKQTSWGTGVEQQNLGLGRFTLNPWTSRVEQRLSRLLRSPRYVEFDFAGLERPTPAEEIGLLGQQVDEGLLTLNEARAIRNMPPVAGGDIPRIKGMPLSVAATPSNSQGGVGNDAVPAGGAVAA